MNIFKILVSMNQRNIIFWFVICWIRLYILNHNLSFDIVYEIA